MQDFWTFEDSPDEGIPSLRTSDGPNGVRGRNFFNGVPSSCFPCGTGLAASFDKSMMHRVGEALGDECRAKSAHVLLGPTVNIQRSPLGGRGFESYSEDPLLSGLRASSFHSLSTCTISREHRADAFYLQSPPSTSTASRARASQPASSTLSPTTRSSSASPSTVRPCLDDLHAARR